jgi:hypothetical protein
MMLIWWMKEIIERINGDIKTEFWLKMKTDFPFG